MTSPDRTVAPAPPAPSSLRLPLIQTVVTDSGLVACAAPVSNLAFSVISVALRAGHRSAPADQCGRSSLLADVLAEGTVELDGSALQDTLDSLGATLGVHAGDDEIGVELTVLSRHLERGVQLLRDLLLRPRLDPDDVARARRQRLAVLEMRAADSSALAADAWRAVIFGSDHPAGRPPAGTPATIEAQTVQTLGDAWRDALRPSRARLSAVGPFDAADFEALARDLSAAMEDAESGAPSPEPSLATPALSNERRVTLVDRPGAPQTQIRVGHLGPAASHPDFYPLHALNHPLGGSFSSRLNLKLREDKGWTYGVRSSFTGGLGPGWFQVAAAVETGVTAAAVGEVLTELEGFVEGGVSEEEVEFARLSLSQTLLRQYESVAAKAALTANVGKYGWPSDYPLGRLEWLEAMDAEQLNRLAREHLRTGSLQILCVGDLERIEPDLSALGLGPMEVAVAAGQGPAPGLP